MNKRHPLSFKNNIILKQAEEFLKEAQTLESETKKSVDNPKNIIELENSKDSHYDYSLGFDDFNSKSKNSIEVNKELEQRRNNPERSINKRRDETSENLNDALGKDDLKLLESIKYLKEKTDRLEEDNSQLSTLNNKLQSQLDSLRDLFNKEKDEYKKIINDYTMTISDFTKKNKSLDEEKKELLIKLSLKENDVEKIQNEIKNFDIIIKQFKHDYENKILTQKNEITLLKNENEKFSNENLKLKHQLDSENKTLTKEFNDKILQIKEKEQNYKTRIKEIELILTRLDNENSSLREYFDKYIKGQKALSSRNENRKSDLCYENNNKDKIMNNSDIKCNDKIRNRQKIDNLREEIENVENLIKNNNLLLKNFEFTKYRYDETGKSMIFNIMKDLEEDSEYMIKLKRKYNEIIKKSNI